MKCPECRHINPDHARFCVNCGLQFELTESSPSSVGSSLPCATCNFLNAPEARFCGGCGTVLERSASARNAQDWAERRQVTVMFCDLVGSTSLAVRLDPEDLRETYLAYRACCVDVINSFGGHVAQYLGDGVLVYFGYPEASECDPERAVRTGLEIIRAVQKLEIAPVGRIQTRIGIATGPVVVGDVLGFGHIQEQAVVGETPNLAARLQGLAQPDRMVIGPVTRRLIGELFSYCDLGLKELKGFEQPVHAWEVIEERHVEGRFQAMRATHTSAELIGRNHELALLLQSWGRAVQGHGQLVQVVGEAGIGKSKLLQAFSERMNREETSILRFYGAPYAQHSAFYPIANHVQRGADLQSSDSVDEKLDKLTDLLARAGRSVKQDLPIFADLLSIPISSRYTPVNLPPPEKKQRIFEAALGQLEGIAKRRPVVVLVEDLHWVDPSTLEFIDILVNHLRRLQILLIVSYRPTFESPWNAVGHGQTLELEKLSRNECQSIIKQVTHGCELPDGLLQPILDKTDGVPLFVEELTKAIMESGAVERTEDGYRLTSPLAIREVPDTLHDSLMARLDHLCAVKELAQIGAVIGREFSFELIRAVSRMRTDDLELSLGRLVESELVFQRGESPRSTYVFKHALIQDTAYNSLLRTKRRELHGRIADVLEQNIVGKVDGQPELIAYHLSEAGENERALVYWGEAASLALQRFAHSEVVSHLQHGIEVLQRLPPTEERDHKQIEMESILGSATMVIRGPGHRDVGAAYESAYSLCKKLGDTENRFPILFGLCRYHWASGQLKYAKLQAQDLLEWARFDGEPGRNMAAATMSALAQWHMGESREAEEQLRGVLDTYRAEEHASLFFTYLMDFGVFGRFYSSFANFSLGHFQLARQFATDALALARRIQQPHAIGFGLLANFMSATMLRDPKQAYRFAEECIPFATENRFPEFVGLARVSRGWALAQQGRVAEGIADVSDGISRWEHTGFDAWRPWLKGLLAECLILNRQQDRALDLLDECNYLIDAQSEYQFESFVHTTRGAALKCMDRSAARAELFEALTAARSHGATGWELRAAMELSSLYYSTHDNRQLSELLQPIVASFPEQEDAGDLREARSLLERLRHE